MYETRIKDQLTITLLTLTNIYSSYDVITGNLKRKQVLIALPLKEKVLRCGIAILNIVVCRTQTPVTPVRGIVFGVDFLHLHQFLSIAVSADTLHFCWLFSIDIFADSLPSNVSYKSKKVWLMLKDYPLPLVSYTICNLIFFL